MIKYLKSKYWIGYIIFVPFLIFDNIFTAKLLETVFDFLYKPEVLNIKLVLVILLTIFGMYTIITIGKIMTKFYENKIIQQSILFLKNAITKHIIYNEKNSNNNLSLLLNDIKILESDYYNPLFQICTNLFISIISIIIILSKNISLGLILILGTFIPVLLTNTISRPIVSISSLWESSYQRYTDYIVRLIEGINTIQNYNIQPIIMKKHDFLANEVGIKFIKLNLSRQAINYISIGLTFAITISSQLYGIYLILIKQLTIGEVMAIIQLSNTVTYPLMAALENYTKMKSTANIQNRIKEFISSKIDSSYDEIGFCNFIQCENLSYVINDQVILNNINFSINKYEKILILGKNGSGKSTLFNIIQGRIRPSMGTIKIDNISYDQIKRNSLYNLISYVPQNVFMFDDTIEFNIMFGNTSNNNFREIIEITHLDTLIENKGKNYIIDSKKNSLSGGEKQRIEIARALYYKRPLLMLDESFSAIDKKTAKEIEKNILLDQHRTIIAIAHTVSIDNVQLFDKIIVLDKGTIREIGTPSELLNQPTSFIHSIISY